MKKTLLFLFAILAAAPAAARAEEKAGKDFRAVIEASMTDLSQFHLPSTAMQVDPESPVQPKDEPGKLFRGLGWAVYGTSAAEIVTTELLMARGGYERNPLMRNRAVRIGVHIVVPVAVNKATEFIRKEGLPRYALWIRIAVVAMWGFTSARNIHIAGGLVEKST